MLFWAHGGVRLNHMSLSPQVIAYSVNKSLPCCSLVDILRADINVEKHPEKGKIIQMYDWSIMSHMQFDLAENLNFTFLAYHSEQSWSKVPLDIICETAFGYKVHCTIPITNLQKLMNYFIYWLVKGKESMTKRYWLTQSSIVHLCFPYSPPFFSCFSYKETVDPRSQAPILPKWYFSFLYPAVLDSLPQTGHITIANGSWKCLFYVSSFPNPFIDIRLVITWYALKAAVAGLINLMYRIRKLSWKRKWRISTLSWMILIPRKILRVFLYGLGKPTLMEDMLWAIVRWWTKWPVLDCCISFRWSITLTWYKKLTFLGAGHETTVSGLSTAQTQGWNRN